jgi:hypothetical protein
MADDVSPRNMTLFLQQVSGEEVPTQGINSLYIACKHEHVLSSANLLLVHQVMVWAVTVCFLSKNWLKPPDCLQWCN